MDASYFPIASPEERSRARERVILSPPFYRSRRDFYLTILFRAFVLHSTEECRRFLASIVIAVCQYFCGDNIDPAFIQARRLLNVVVHLLAVVVPSRDLILLCVLLLFPSRFSFPEQRLNGEATTRTIRRASCVIESPLLFSSALCLGFHFLFPFAIAFVIRYRSAVAKK